jgi:hypothetical protein
LIGEKSQYRSKSPTGGEQTAQPDCNSWGKLDLIIQSEGLWPPMHCSFFSVAQVRVISGTVALAALSWTWTFMCDAQTHLASTQVSGAPSGVGQTSTDTATATSSLHPINE